MVEFIYGKKRSGKTQYICEKIASEINLDNLNIMIVPEQYTLKGEAEFLRRTNLDGFIGFEISSFKRISFRLLELYKNGSFYSCDELTRTLILKKIIADNNKSLKYYSKIAMYPGFLKEIETTIDLFHSAGVTNYMLKQYINSIEDKQLLLKMNDFLLIYDEYMGYTLGNKVIINNPMLMVLEDLECMEYFKDKTVYIDFFDGFTFIEMQLLCEIAKKAKNFTMLLDVDKDDYDIRFEYNIIQYKLLKNLFNKNGINISEKKFINKIENVEIDWISNNFMLSNNNVFENIPKHYSFFTKLNQNEEIEKIAQHIKYLVRVKGYKWSEIGIYCGNIDLYEFIIQRIFWIYDIPYFFDKKVTVYNHPMISYIIAIFKSIKNNYRYEDIMQIIKNPYYNIEDTLKDDFDSYCIQNGINFKKFRNSFSDETMDDVRKDLIGKLIQIEKEVCLKIEKCEFLEALKKLIEILKLKESTDKLVAILEKNNELEVAQQYYQIQDKLMYIFEQMEMVFSYESIDLTLFLSLFENLMLKMELGIIPPTLDHVFIGDHERSITSKFKILFMIGLNDGEIPKNINKTGLFDDKEINELKKLGINLFNSGYEKNLFTLSKFTNNLTLGSEQVILSYCQQNMNGQSLRPSIYLTQIKTKMPLLKEFDESSKDLFYKDDIKSIKHLFIRNFREIKDCNFPLEWAKDWHKIYNKNFDERVKKYSNYLNRASKEKNKICEMFDSHKIYSISQIEQYNKCQYAYFLKYGLKLKEVPKYHFRSLDYGIIMHYILEKFSKYIKDNNYSWQNLNKEEIDNIVDNLFKYELNKDYLVYFNENVKQKYILDRLNKISKDACLLLTKQIQCGKFIPSAFEMSFGGFDKDAEIPICMKDTNGIDYYLKGKIDRVDLYTEEAFVYIRIVDYKSSNHKIDFTKVFNGLQIQLMYYLKMAIETFKPNSKAAAALYFEVKEPMVEWVEKMNIEDLRMKEVQLDGVFIKDKDIISAMDLNLLEKSKSNVINVSLNSKKEIKESKYILNENDFSFWFTHIDTIISKSVSKIRSGAIDINPTEYKDELACKYCDYNGICQYDSYFNNSPNNMKKLDDSFREVENNEMD